MREPRKLRPSAYPPLGIIGTNNSRACRRCVAVSSAEPNRAVNGVQERGLAVSVPSHAVERRRPRGTRAVRPYPHSLSATRGSFRAGSLGDEGERAGDPRNFKPNRQAALVGAGGSIRRATPLSGHRDGFPGAVDRPVQRNLERLDDDGGGHARPEIDITAAGRVTLKSAYEDEYGDVVGGLDLSELSSVDPRWPNGQCRCLWFRLRVPLHAVECLPFDDQATIVEDLEGKSLEYVSDAFMEFTATLDRRAAWASEVGQFMRWLFCGPIPQA